MSKNTGFSLIEVLIAIAIVALIAVVSLPLFSLGITNIKRSEMDSTDLFILESKIEGGHGNDVGDGNIVIYFGGDEINIGIDLYEVKDDKGNVSLKYFKYKQDSIE